METWQDGHAFVGIEFWVDASIVDAPDLWFESGDNAAKFYDEALRRGWTAPEGIAIVPGTEDEVIGSVARAHGGRWWTDWTPDWGTVAGPS